jgi:hypothetical protein
MAEETATPLGDGGPPFLTRCRRRSSYAVSACPSGIVLADSDMNRNFAASRNASTASLSRGDDPYYPDSGGRQTPWSATRTIVVAGLAIFFLLALLVCSEPACTARCCPHSTHFPEAP